MIRFAAGYGSGRSNTPYDNAENGRGRADTEGQGKNGDGGEGGVLAELSNAVAAIADDGIKPIAKAFLANLFFHLFDTAQLDPRGPLRFLRRQACTNVFLDQHFEVGMNFPVEVYLDAAK